MTSSAPRLAEPRDIDACAAIYQAAASLAFPWLPPEAISGDQLLADLREEELWVAEREGMVAGFVSIYLPERVVHSLYVHPLHHRRGIGRDLLTLALQRCGGHAELKCQEGNRQAAFFYTQLGWQPVDWGWSTAGAWIRYRR